MFYTAEHLQQETGLPMDLITTDSAGRPRGIRIHRDPGVPPQYGDITFNADDAARILQELKPVGYALLSEAVRRSRLSADRLRRAAGDPVIAGMTHSNALYSAHGLDAAWAKLDPVGHRLALREHKTLVG